MNIIDRTTHTGQFYLSKIESIIFAGAATLSSMEQVVRSPAEDGGGGAVLDTGSDDSRASTIRGRLEELTRQYTHDIRGGGGVVSQHVVRQLIASLELFWHQASHAGIFSSNEDVDEYSTTALQILWIPYLIADVYQRVQDTIPIGDARAPDNRDAAASTAYISTEASAMRGVGQSGWLGRKDERMPHEPDAGGESASHTSPPSVTALIMTTQSRQEALAQSHRWFDLFLEWMQRIALVDDKTIEQYREYRPDQRSTRVELSRRTAELYTRWQTLEQKVHYARAQKRRLRAIMNEEGDEADTSVGARSNRESADVERQETIDGGADVEEEERECALARLRWSCYDAFHQMQLSSRELTMLESIRPDQRAAIVAEYQQRMRTPSSASSSRQTYTILPGGQMTMGTLRHPQPIPLSQVTQSGAVYSPVVVHNATASGNPSLFREQLRSELMMERNAPTMTLQEFAEKEMTAMQRQMDGEARAQAEQAEEDARLGPEGVEERERQKDSRWADWKDDHPAFGPSSKGNF